MFIIDWIIDLTENINLGSVAKFLVWGLVVFIGWRLSLWIFPQKKCRRCKGTGAWGFGGALRQCGRCGGVGRENRIGAP